MIVAGEGMTHKSQLMEQDAAIGMRRRMARGKGECPIVARERSFAAAERRQ